MGLALVALFLVLIAPVKAGAALVWNQRNALGIKLGVMIWGVPLQMQISLKRNGKGEPYLERRFMGKARPLRPRGAKGKSGIKALKAIGGARALLFRLIPVKKAYAFIQLGGENAALSAVLCGMLQILNALIPGVEIACRPRYGGEWGIKALCIAQARLGTLIAVGLPVYFKIKAASGKEKEPWIVPSET